MFTTRLFLIFLGSLAASAANDWSSPCFQGSCSYDLAHPSGSTGTLKVWGPKTAISDITTAADWLILGCDPNALAQDIRLVCRNARSGLCNHLFSGAGAVGKLVRLPKDCGKSAFARVAKHYIPEDQLIHPDIAALVDSNSEVQALTLDTEFSQVSQTSGVISFALQVSTNPNLKGLDIAVNKPSLHRHSRIEGSATSLFIERAYDDFTEANRRDHLSNFPPLDFEKSFPLFDLSVSCPANGHTPAWSVEVQADIDVKAHVSVDIGIVATGTVIPANIDSLGLFSNVDANIGGTLSLRSAAMGSFDSGRQTLFEQFIGGFEIPSILTIGSKFKLLGEAEANLTNKIDFKTNLNYHIGGAELYFPGSPNHQSGIKVNPGDVSLKLSSSANLSSHETVKAHLIPVIEFGIDVFNRETAMAIDLNLDTSSTLDLSLNAHSDPSKLEGCMGIRTGIDANAVAKAPLLKIFDRPLTVPLFKKDYDIYNKCLTPHSKREALITKAPSNPHAKRDGPMCPSTANVQTIEVLSEAISGDSIFKL